LKKISNLKKEEEGLNLIENNPKIQMINKRNLQKKVVVAKKYKFLPIEHLMILKIESQNLLKSLNKSNKKNKKKIKLKTNKKN
jgi:hypothetical protein